MSSVTLMNENRQLRVEGNHHAEGRLLQFEIEGQEQKIQFLKWCIGGALGLVLGIFLLSFIQEVMRRRRVRRLKKKRNAVAIGTLGGKKGPGLNPEKIQNDLQKSLRVKKFVNEEELDPTSPFSEASFNDDSSTEQDGKLSSSDKNNIFRKSSSTPMATSSKKTCQGSCELCEKPFVVGDDVCESNSPRCNHIFHKDCIASWLPYQNTCPVCSETFVILNESTV